MKRLIAIALCLSSLFALCACGSNGGNEPQAAPDPEYVYKTERSVIAEKEAYYQARAFVGKGCYLTCFEKVGNETPEGVVPEYEGQYDIYENRIFYWEPEAGMTRLSGYTPLPRKENTEDWKDFYSSSDIVAFAALADGRIVLIETVSVSGYSGPDNLTWEDEEYWQYNEYYNDYYIRLLDNTGAELSCAAVDASVMEYIYAPRIVVDKDGYLLIPAETAVIALGIDGRLAYRIDSENYIDSIFTLRDGRIVVHSWDDQGACLRVLDPGSRSFGERISISSDIYVITDGGGEYDFYYVGGSNFFGYKLESSESVKLFNWTNCDVNPYDLGAIFVSDDGVVSALSSYYNSITKMNTFEMLTISRVPYDPSAQKPTLVLATQYISYELQDMVVSFNRTNDAVRIEIKDYSEYNTEDDYSAGLTKMNTEILAGQLPDLIDLSGMPYDRLAAKGYLVDLYPFIDSDPELSREDFFPNILAAMERDGKLCSTLSSFYIETVMGPASVIGDKSSWTYEDFDAALAQMPAGCEAFEHYTTRDEILTACLFLDLNEYMDWSTGSCSFDSEGFIGLLEFANRFPASFDWESYTWAEEDSADVRISSGRQMLLRTGLYSFEDSLYNGYQYNYDAVYIGYPTYSGSGHMLHVNSGIAMTSACSDKAAAWEFLRYFFTEKYQDSTMQIPSNVNSFNKKLEAAMRPDYVKDEKGEIMLDEEGNKIRRPRGSIGLSDGTIVEFYALTREQADRLLALISATTKVANYDEAIIEIIKNEAEAYFSGQKSAQEVARLIQSKLNIYINEQR